MDCKEYRKSLEHAGLKPAKQAELEEHLLSCPECREFSREMDLSLKLFKAVEQGRNPPEPSPDFAERVLSRVASPVPRSRWLRLLPLAGLNLLLALALGLGLYFALHRQEPNRSNTRLKVGDAEMQATMTGESFSLNIQGMNPGESINFKF